MKQRENRQRWIYNLTGIFILLSLSVILVLVLHAINWEPSGNDIWGHMYKGQYMYQALKKGDLYPLFDMKWYNGIQLYRYWPPLSYYVMALCLFFAGGDVISAYILLLGIVFFVGGLPFVIWGNITDRRRVGVPAGALWFFMPAIIKVSFCDGNLPQIITTAITPYVIFFLCRYVHDKSKKAAVGLFASMFFMVLGHVMVTAITGLAAFIYLFIDQLINKDWKRMFMALCYMVCGILLAGIIIVPALSGGGVAAAEQTGSTILVDYSYPLSVSLNPFYRFVINSRDVYYFGIGVILICILGAFLARGKRTAGFIFAIILVALTTTSAAVFLSKLPFSSLFWMTRFSPMMYGFFFASLMEWKTIKNRYLAVVAGILILEIIPSLMLNDYRINAGSSTKRDVSLLRDNTVQRASVMDSSEYGSYPSFGVSGDEGVAYTFGWAWQGAVTGRNIVLLNEALEQGRFLYVFDRSIELGDDAVLVQKNKLAHSEGTEEELLAAADKCGYSLVSETDTGYVFKLSANGTLSFGENFGVVSEYKDIAIGKYADEMTTLYPCFKMGDSIYIDDYDMDELAGYDTIFLSGFEYRNRANAENLVRKLGEKGVRVVIDTTHMPVTSGSKEQKFLNVLHQEIRFTNSYPELTINGQNISTGPFMYGDRKFTTGYIAYLDNPLGTFRYDTHTLTFFGYNDDTPNVYFLGINLMYFVTSTGDDTAAGILDDILSASHDSISDRKIVPVSIEYSRNKLIIDTDSDNVNTTIAYQDIFVSDSEIREDNNLLVVDAGRTEIELHYPLFLQGLIVSILGMAAFAVLYYRDGGGCHEEKEKMSGHSPQGSQCSG